MLRLQAYWRHIASQMKKQKQLVIILLFCLPWLWIALRLHLNHGSGLYTEDVRDHSHLPLILLWTALDGDYANWRHKIPGSQLKCGSSIACRVSTSHSHLANASAVVVSLADIFPWTWAWLPMRVPKDQIWVAKWSEAPWFYRARKFLDPRAGGLDNIFSWTVSYQSPATFQSSMFEKPLDNCSWVQATQHRDGTTSPNLTASLDSKSELALWIVSHCQTNSRREDYVRELQKYMKVTVLGKCGLGKDESARERVHRAKFYLAFENSVCDEYITEKFHFTLANYDTVPVVLGPKRQDYEKVSPPNSFIHTADFQSPEALAQYLLFLDSHPEEYLKYLAWKGHYEVECRQTWTCNMCERLHEIKDGKLGRPPIIKDFSKVWDSSHCYSSWNHSQISLE